MRRIRFRRLRFVASVAVIALAATTAVPVAAHDTAGGNSSEAKAAGFRKILAREKPSGNDAPHGERRCVDGYAGVYECENIDLVSYLSLEELGLTFANDMWGWTDSRKGKDYALVGGTEGMVAVNISSPIRPDVVGIVPTHTSDLIFWRDIKVYKDHAYIVSEDTDHGMQVFDLKRLRGVKGDAVIFEPDAHYDEFGNAHNININEETGYLYAIGTSTCDGGLHMVDISQPDDPQFAGCYSDHGYIHDTQCVVYRGPDREHLRKELCFNSVADFDPDTEELTNAVSVVDVSDKANPVELSYTLYDLAGYSHQGWLTPTHRFFLHNDELDELFGLVPTTATRVWDMLDLDAPVVDAVVSHSTTAIGHNAYTRGRKAFASNYTAGLQVFDTSRLFNGKMPMVGYFDMYPENDDASFEGGTWSNYPYFSRTGIVAATSMDRGLFILRTHLS